MGVLGTGVWFLSIALEVYIVVRCLSTHAFRKYFSIGLFAGAMVLRDAGGFVVLRAYGLASPQYTATFYFTDALLTVLMYLVIMHMYEQVFEYTGLRKYVLGAALLLLCLTALFSYVAVRGGMGPLSFRFATELSQDLYFVGLVLTYLLWAAVFKLRESRARLVQFVLALGVYFSGTAALYAARNMFPVLRHFSGALIPILGMLLLASWAYTFTLVPEGARLAPAHLVREATAER